ncbi:MAG: glucan ABC transporter ATP-binding protein/ permease, partial [Acetobacteraceae bacterium]|nr:glucan ABC transporter ATP-binding protein/ permease [Acetobacteraceae bacterium]
MAALLCLGSVVVAGLLFLEPVLFGRVIGLLGESDQLRRDVLWQQATVLLSIWAGVGVAGIAANMATALQAERLAHRNRIQVIGRYFSHVLTLPLSFHGDVHSGRLMKVMVSGSDALFAVWLVFFRDQLA